MLGSNDSQWAPNLANELTAAETEEIEKVSTAHKEPKCFNTACLGFDVTRCIP